jgi:hypothetical protein
MPGRRRCVARPRVCRVHRGVHDRILRRGAVLGDGRSRLSALARRLRWRRPGVPSCRAVTDQRPRLCGVHRVSAGVLPCRRLQRDQRQRLPPVVALPSRHAAVTCRGGAVVDQRPRLRRVLGVRSHRVVCSRAVPGRRRTHRHGLPPLLGACIAMRRQCGRVHADSRCALQPVPRRLVQERAVMRAVRRLRKRHPVHDADVHRVVADTVRNRHSCVRRRDMGGGARYQLQRPRLCTVSARLGASGLPCGHSTDRRVRPVGRQAHVHRVCTAVFSRCGLSGRLPAVLLGPVPEQLLFVGPVQRDRRPGLSAMLHRVPGGTG